MLTIEGRISGGYEVIGENGNAVFRSDSLETAAIVRDYLANANMTDDERQTAKAAIRIYDETVRLRHEEYERKRTERREKAKARAEAKKTALIENA